MIVTIGEISVRLALLVAQEGNAADSARRGPDHRLSHFIDRDNRADIDLTVTRVVGASWDEVMTPEDFAQARHIVKRIEERFPFTTVLFARENTPTASRRVGDILLPMPAAFDAGHVSVIIHPGFLVTVDHRIGRADALVRIEDNREREASLTPVLQGVLALCAPSHGALMLHAASLVVDGRGYLFIGSSGAGKSTIAGAVDPAQVLSDDGSWCSQNGGGFSLFPTPFSQIDPAPIAGDPVPLDRILFLEQGPENRIVDLSPGRAMTMLLSNHIHFFRFMGNGAAARTFGLAEALCRTHPVSTLVFTRDSNPNSFFRTIADDTKKAV